jgi:spore coat protein U-like protein
MSKIIFALGERKMGNVSVKWKNRITAHKFEALAILLCLILSASVVYALTYLWSGSAGATITTEVENIKVYDDQDNEVTSINFGNINPSTTIGVSLTIKNISPNATITIRWASTLSSVTNKITDYWRTSAGNDLYVSLYPGHSISTVYSISVASDCPLQSYSWTLYIIPG